MRNNLSRISYTVFRLAVFTIGILAGIVGCNKSDLKSANPYPPGPAPLVQFLDAPPQPALGAPGTNVTFMVKGLKGQESNFTFYLNQTPATVVSVGDSTITVQIPANASSGSASVVLNGQYYFGPIVNVKGKVGIAVGFKAFNGATGNLSGSNLMQAYLRADGNLILVGAFSDYNHQASATDFINGIVLIDQNGNLVSSKAPLSGLAQGLGVNGGYISSIVRLSDGQYVIGGNFSQYNVRTGINNVTMLNSDGSLDSTTIALVNSDPVHHPENNKDTVPAFNGGVVNTNLLGFGTLVQALYANSDDQVIAVGNFTEYNSYYYPRSTKDGRIVDRFNIGQLVRFNYNGSLDSTFNTNPAATPLIGYKGANGSISSSVQLKTGTYAGKILVAGAFTTFNGIPAPHYALIDDGDGHVITDFFKGSGANDAINTVTYNPTTKKILLTGIFKSFNGTAVNSVAMLNDDGTLNTSFTFGAIQDGVANYAGQLNNGKIIVSGLFTHYNNIVRSGFMLLNADGSLAAGYNNTGTFNGVINQIVESKTDLGNNGVILIGSFTRFDNKQVNNIVKLEFQP